MAAEMRTTELHEPGPGAHDHVSVPASGPARRPSGRRRAKTAASKPAIGPVVLERAARVIRVLGHPVRLRLLETLEDGERNVTDLVLAHGMSQARVSQHLAILRAEGVVGFRRDGGRIYYRIVEPKVHRILDCIRECDLPEMNPKAVRALFDLTGDL